jgi:hypothetical protein
VQPRPECPPLYRSLLLLFLFLTFAVTPFAQSPPTEGNTPLDDALRQLADRVAAIPGLRGPLRLEFFQNASTVADTGNEWQEIFRKVLEQSHLTVTQDPGAGLLRVGLAETPTQLVLSASVHAAEKDEVRLVTLPRANFRTGNLPVVPVRIEKQLIYECAERILDASSLSNGTESGMLLLAYQGSELSVFRLDGTGTLKQSTSLAAAAARPFRDLHAELVVHADDANVLLTGKTCQFTWAGPADLKCHSAKPAWRGSTVLTPSCDAGSWKLQANGTDWTTSDLLQVVPVDSSRKGSTGMFSDFPGPILSTNGEQNPASALVVTRNLRTGNYEVYRITLACGH